MPAKKQIAAIKLALLSKEAIFRIILFALIWWILTAGKSDSWVVGVPTVVISVFVSMALTDQYRNNWRILSVMRFVAFFAKASVRGGFDVARRVFHPRLPLNPDWVDYPLTLKKQSARILMANIISLLPGTLSVELQDKQIKVHVLDNNQDVRSELQAVESAVGALLSSDSD
ncbi:MAG: Na+/H+ antiporter subunit E [Alphaproteobacteria bacterium]|nr:Na+/H+ antiporter subunit E [Alphaproteobacteria bacterium]